MSKNVAILEGDVAKRFNNVKKIQLHNTGGGTDYWVPESETRLVTKHINENGTYKAEDEDGHPYGYSEVTVSGIGKVVGYDENNDLVEIDRDENDKIRKKYAPASIAFVRYPSRLLYNDGDKINLAGAIVQAYLPDGTPWEGDAQHKDGTIPYDELVLDPTSVDIRDKWADRYSDDDGLNVLRLTAWKDVKTTTKGGGIEYTIFSPPIGYGDFDYDQYEGSGTFHSNVFFGKTKSSDDLGGVNWVFVTRVADEYSRSGYRGYCYFPESGRITVQGIAIGDEQHIRHAMSDGGYREAGWNFDTIVGTSEKFMENIPISTKIPTNQDVDNLRSVGIPIQVKWVIPGSNKELDTSFEVKINRIQS